MVLIQFDPDEQHTLSRAQYDRDCAVRVLAIAADYLRRGKPLPVAFDLHFAEALEFAATQPNAKLAGEALLTRLFLKGMPQGRAPSPYMIDLHFRRLRRALQRYRASDVPSTQRKLREAAKKYGFRLGQVREVGVVQLVLARRYGVSPKTIEKRRTDYRKANRLKTDLEGDG